MRVLHQSTKNSLFLLYILITSRRKRGKPFVFLGGRGFPKISAFPAELRVNFWWSRENRREHSQRHFRKTTLHLFRIFRRLRRESNLPFRISKSTTRARKEKTNKRECFENGCGNERELWSFYFFNWIVSYGKGYKSSCFPMCLAPFLNRGINYNWRLLISKTKYNKFCCI